ncbi:MAG: preprotein translocase subunit SecG [Rhodospirillales bacterium]|nr:MAG: preprotein translocase subunit SecG [Rhodospirillales bacterium]
MITVILVIHLILAIALVGVVLLQRSEGGALGIGGGGGMSGFMTGRSTANLLTRATAILAALFICTSLTLAKLAGTSPAPRSILDHPMPPVQEQPAEPRAPAAPLAR